MSGVQDPRAPRTGPLSFVDDVTTTVRRAAPGPMLVRLGVFAAGLLAQVVAWPGAVLAGRALLVLIVLAVLPVLAPRTRLVTVGIVAAVLGWLAATTAYGEPLRYWRVVLLAGLLYLLHTLAALAAVLPYDAVVSPGVLGRWLVRAGVVLLLTVAVAMFTLLIPVYLGDQRYLLASLVGLAVTAGLAGYLALLVRRR